MTTLIGLKYFNISTDIHLFLFQITCWAYTVCENQHLALTQKIFSQRSKTYQSSKNMWKLDCKKAYTPAVETVSILWAHYIIYLYNFLPYSPNSLSLEYVSKSNCSFSIGTQATPFWGHLNIPSYSFLWGLFISSLFHWLRHLIILWLLVYLSSSSEIFQVGIKLISIALAHKNTLPPCGCLNCLRGNHFTFGSGIHIDVHFNTKATAH